MKIYLIKSVYHNEHHVEIWPPYFSFSPLFRPMLKFWWPYGYMMPVKKSSVGRSHPSPWWGGFEIIQGIGKFNLTIKWMWEWYLFEKELYFWAKVFKGVIEDFNP
jgi:hypothetical protein